MILKRAFDILFSIIGIIVSVPLFLLIALAIKVSMPGPVFFIQTRIGHYGHPFTMIKFRTMVFGNSENTVTVLGDNRIEPLGTILRKYKLDELPELWNVFIGEMSFVGPRPDVPGYADKLQGEDKRILELRPGITGPATLKYADEEKLLAIVDDPIKYNDEVIFPDKVKINLEYLDNWSLWLDIKIIFNTIFRTNY